MNIKIMANQNKIDVKKIDTIFELPDLVDCNGNVMSLEFYKGKKILLVVNITTKDKNSLKFLRMLSDLNRKYKEKGFAILAFPCFQFGSFQSMDEIQDFLMRYDLDIGDIYDSIDVNGSKNVPPLYQYLKLKKPGTCGGFINSNFTMFVIGKDGRPLERLSSNVHPYILEEIIENNL